MNIPVFIKASKSRISVAKEIREVNRLRTRYERSMTNRLMGVFKKVGREAAKEYKQSGRVSTALVPLKSDLEKVFNAHYTAVIKTFSDRVYDNRKYQTFTDLVFAFIEKEGANKIRGITATTGRQILQAITAGEKDGEGVDAIAKRIVEKTSGSIGRARAATIARTETHAAASYATHTATKELNLPAQKKRWVSVSDGRTRDHHKSANGQEVGIDEKFVIRYRGSEILMEYPHDGSGGAANNVNCRCLAVYFTDEDALFDSFDGFEDVEEVLPVPPVPEPEAIAPLSGDPFAPNAPFRLPKQQVESINVASVAAAKRVFKEYIAVDADAPVYSLVGRWEGDKNIGKASIGGASKEAYQNTAQAIKEIEYIGKYIGVANLRGIAPATSKRINGSMGGGVLHLSKDAMDIYSADRRGDRFETVDEINAKIDVAREKWNDLRDELTKVGNAGDTVRFEQIEIEIVLAQRKYFELVDRRSLIREAEGRGGGATVSTYKLGDDKSDRPWSTKEYFPDGLDKTRALVYHEFGHHIHQTYKLKERYRRDETYLESRLASFWRQTSKDELEYHAPSTYGMSNQHEYFVESFAMYMLNRKDMMHPKMLELIEEILNDRGA